MGKFILSKFVIFGLLFTKDGFRGIQICQKQAEILLSSQKFSSNSSPLNNLIIFFCFGLKKTKPQKVLASKRSCLKNVMSQKGYCCKQIMSQKCHVSKRLLLQIVHISKCLFLPSDHVSKRS